MLNRTTRRMSLTEAGARYYEQVARILDDLSEAEQSLGPLQHEPSGTLRVSAPMSLSLVAAVQRHAALPGTLSAGVAGPEPGGSPHRHRQGGLRPCHTRH
ncbi:hypothetical protein [Achromobacter insolitus]|uniref:hypothetical protein n=1 Tax=Achromobacter insolitus TaxID=217204 RepID=UPI00313427F0